MALLLVGVLVWQGLGLGMGLGMGMGRVLVDDSRQAERSPRTPAAPVDEERAAVAFVPILRAALLAGRRARLTGAASDGAARRELLTLAANLERLRITDFGLRYVDESEATLTGAERRRYGDDAWVVDVRLTWRLRGVVPVASAMEIPLVLTWKGENPAFVTTRTDDGGRVPLWWQTGVEARRRAATVVVAAEGGRLRTLTRQATAAVDTVRRTLPAWRGPLVVEAARTSGQFSRACGLPPASARAVAAVTTTAGGSDFSRNPAHIYLNSPVFDNLGPQGQQIVMSHEAAHVAMGAATTSAPLWLSEGIADYIALVDSEIPVPVLATQIRALVRRQGPPERLPGRAELDGGNQNVGAWYEAAWLAALLIAEEHGETALLELHRNVDADGDIRRAFREVLGTTEQELVDAWRAELTRLAS